MSSELNHLFSALSKLQGKIEKAKKDQAGYKNNYMYAELSQYIDVSKELLEENGLSVVQMPGQIRTIEITKEFPKIEIRNEINQSTNKMQEIETKTLEFKEIKIPVIEIITWIGHVSGQFISGPMEILVEKLPGMNWGQSVGSAITYGRRYVRAASLGMAEKDNDNQGIKKEIKNNNFAPKPQILHKVGTKEIEYLKEIFKEPERLKKILDWAKVEKIEDITMAAFKMIENKAQQEKAQEKSKEKEKLQENVCGSENNFVTEIQANFIKKLVTPEKLVAILRDHKITRLEEMNLKDYLVLYDTLRVEGSPPVKSEQNKAA